MMNNYNGNMPYRTSYGYSGVNAYPAKKKTNVAMYAIGGAVAGAVVGAGAMWAYNQQWGNDWEVHRRRRMVSNGRMQWCTVQEGARDLATGAMTSYAGDMMECSDCTRRYGVSRCPSADGCYSQGGCSYTTASNYNRDDIESDAIMAATDYYTWPLKVTFINITGTGINTDYTTGNLCPPSTASDIAFARNNFNKATVFKADLFLLLTAQTQVPETGSAGSADAPAHRRRATADGAHDLGPHVLFYIFAAVGTFFSSLPYQ